MPGVQPPERSLPLPLHSSDLETFLTYGYFSIVPGVSNKPRFFEILNL